MAANPNPLRITDEMWRFWEEFKKIEPTVQLGGIFASKPGYHNTRANLPPTDYSRKLPPDQVGPGDKASAIDLTFPSAQRGDYSVIRKYSTRLLNSGKDLKDTRGNVLREFYGNADGNQTVDGWDFYYVRPAVSDSSHLWHIHLSFLRKYNNSRGAHNAILSILSGETYAAYVKRNTVPSIPPPPPLPPVPPIAGCVLVQEINSPSVYLTNGTTYTHVINVVQLRLIQAAFQAKGTFNRVITVPSGAIAAGVFGTKS